MRLGSVALVGAGPGRAEFLTLAALREIQSAEVILYDALLAADVLELFPKKAKSVYVGKRCGQHALKQHEINALLSSFALKGKRVVRLKGGDPYIFGRGAEEVEELRAHNIPYKIIPGLSALNGIAAQVALPLTVRGKSNEFRVIQGHSLPEEKSYWQDLAKYQGTLVIFMGFENLSSIASRLLAEGAAEHKALALLESEENQIIRSQRADLAKAAAGDLKRASKGPAIIYIGENVDLMDENLALEKVPAYDTALAHFS